MTNQNNSERPIGRYQDFLDAALGSNMTQAMESSHASRVLEAVNHAEQGNYAKAAASFLLAFGTAPTDVGKQHCQTLARGADNANSAYENALENAASEMSARETAKVSWDSLKRELSVYLSFLGVYFSERKKYSESIEYYDRSIKINPSYAMAYFSRGGTKADLYLFDEAIQDLLKAAQLFYEQNDIPNYQNAKEILQQLQEFSSGSSREKLANNQQLQENLSKKDFGSYEQLLHNAARLKAFSIQVAREFPKSSQPQQRELAAGLLFKYLEDNYDAQEEKYTDLDREFMKAMCFQQGLDLQKYHLRNKPLRGFFIGLSVGGLIVYAISRLI